MFLFRTILPISSLELNETQQEKVIELVDRKNFTLKFIKDPIYHSAIDLLEIEVTAPELDDLMDYIDDEVYFQLGGIVTQAIYEATKSS